MFSGVPARVGRSWAEPTAAYFALKGFQVVSCPWKNTDSRARQVLDQARFREQLNLVLRDRFVGVLQTEWSGAGGFLDRFERSIEAGERPPDERSEVACFLSVLETISELSPGKKP